jgi:hypothetical protein
VTPRHLFDVETPLGFRVRTTPSYWELLQRKHLEIKGQLAGIQNCLTRPDQVRRSKQDPGVYLFYQSRAPYHLCVVTKQLNGDGFVITCYLTDSIKEGDRVWPTSE